jgi:hypothetical protein
VKSPGNQTPSKAGKSCVANRNIDKVLESAADNADR